MEEFAERFTGSPHGHARLVGELCLMKAAQERCGDVTVLGMIVVPGAVEICWHNRNEVAGVFAAIGSAEHDARDLCCRVPLIRRFKFSRKQLIFANGLLGVLWIDTARP